MQAEGGFTLMELMIATGIFLVISAAMLGLLQLSQQKYSSETQISGAFQETRLAIDQIVRDFNVSGYPSQSIFSQLPGNTAQYATSPVAWSPNYLAGTPCVLASPPLGAPCTTPGDYDLILETDLGNGLVWIRYQLIGTTLFRSVVPKTAGTDPAAPPVNPTLVVPFLTNVMNFQQGQPIFKFSCDTSAGPQPCPSAGANDLPNRIRDVDILLIVMTKQPDLQTGKPKIVELQGRGHRLNPSF